MRQILERTPAPTFDLWTPTTNRVETNRLVGSRAADGYVMGYSPLGTPYTVNLDVLAGDVVRLWWYDPRTGESMIAEQPSVSTMFLTAPSSEGWVVRRR